jgi:lipopolysaccharide transport system ATP-binding protein
LQGARIDRIEILNTSGQVVNILTAGDHYDFVLEGEFLDDCAAIYFGIHIKNISGFEITGQRYPVESRTIPSARKGETFRMIFHFSLRLLPGSYFVGGGVWSAAGPNCLHRVLDAAMFKVMSDAPIHAFGNCNLEARQPELQIA